MRVVTEKRIDNEFNDSAINHEKIAADEIEKELAAYIRHHFVEIEIHKPEGRNYKELRLELVVMSREKAIAAESNLLILKQHFQNKGDRVMANLVHQLYNQIFS